MPEVKRQTAIKCSIKKVLEGNYVQRPGWEPNYIQLGNEQISRINIVAVIVGKEGNSFLIDDGSGQIQVMFFGEQNKFAQADIGQVVLIIGRPREYNQKRFIVPEIIRIVENDKWIEYRKKELELQDKESPIIAEEKPAIILKENPVVETKQVEKIDEGRFEDNYASIILATIRKLDLGDGANISEVITASGLHKAEKYIISLINEGEIFEIRTGKLKILE